MGEKVAHTGFADRNLFVAETTQPRVAPMSVKSCRTTSSPRGRKSCVMYTKRVSYAVPLEVVFLTPLHSWNPFRLQYKGDNLSPLGRTVLANGRKGKVTQDGAFNGTNSRHFYQTPVQFFRSGREVNSDPADTVRGVVGVLDPDGQVRSVVASGVRIFLPEIKGLGVLRTRYPIMPVYAEGSTVWKELEALREVVMNMQEYAKYFRKEPSFLNSADTPAVETDAATKAAVTPGTTDVTTVKLSANQNQSSDKGAAISENIRLKPGPALQEVRLSNNDSPEQPSISAATAAQQLLSGDSDDDDFFKYYASVHRGRPSFVPPSHVTLVTSPSTRTYVTLHVHTVELNRAQLYSLMKRGKRLTVRSTLDGGHSHLLTIGFHKKTQYFYIHKCDQRAKCWDGHSDNLEKIQNSNVVTMTENLRRYG